MTVSLLNDKSCFTWRPVRSTFAPGWYFRHVDIFGRSATGPVLTSDLLMGERYDAREETPGWSRPGFGAQGWKPVLVNDEATAKPVAQSAAPTRIEQEITPIAVTSPEKGVHIFDLGQNMVGTVRLRVAARPGRR